MAAVIVEERPDTADAISLVEELDAYLIPLYPIEAHYGYDVAKLLRERVAFFVIRDDGVAAGCGGVQLFGSDYAEVKRMYVRPAFRGRGYGRLMLDHLAAYVRSRGIGVLRLETGNLQAEALGLYESYGFKPCDPFGDYVASEHNLFYEKRLSDARNATA